MKCSSAFDKMTWLVYNNNRNKLVVIFESQEKKEKKIFKINLMDIDPSISENISDKDFPYAITMSSQEFMKHCKDMNSISEKLDIKVSSNKLMLSGKGDIGQVEFEINGGVTIAEKENNAEKIVQGLFDLKLLLIFTKCTSLSNNVTIYIKNDYPLIISYPILSLGTIKLALAQSNNKN
jgi:proliferating cell nuclear antigen PCNA